MLYLFIVEEENLLGKGVVEGVVKKEEIIEDEIDRILSKKDGKIYRQRDAQL